MGWGMRKLLFFDYSRVSRLRGFVRRLERPEKFPGNPLLIGEEPWEHGNFTMYGSVVKADGKPFQLWYSVVSKPLVLHVAYAESDDGIHWRKPPLDVFSWDGRKTNIVSEHDIHGAAVIYDERDPREDYRYKMIGGFGGGSKAPIYGFHSPDGIHWKMIRPGPIIGTGPDSPMGLLRLPDGRYAAYHRKQPYGRKIFRSESWDFLHWSGEPRMVLEPDAQDPPMTQFYGIGSVPYGPFELGTLWMFHIDPEDGTALNGYQEAELAYARSGYAWHRAAQGQPFLPHGEPGEWDQGNLQCASAPVFLKDEIRYYYAGTNIRHSRHWEHNPQRAGLGMATLKPDRFIALVAGPLESELVTVPLVLPSGDIRLNANVEPGGWVGVEIQDENGRPVDGFRMEECAPIAGDSLSHEVRWSGGRPDAFLRGARYRLRIGARRASLYSVFAVEDGETPHYARFEEFAVKL